MRSSPYDPEVLTITGRSSSVAIERSRTRIARARDRISESRARIEHDPTQAVRFRMPSSASACVGADPTTVVQVAVSPSDVPALVKGLAAILARDGLGEEPEARLAVDLMGRIQLALCQEAVRADRRP